MQYRKILGGLIVSLALTACSVAQPESTPKPNTQATSVAVATVVPTKQPTPQPSVVGSASPTPAASGQPTFTFEPRHGGAGTKIYLDGWNVAPEASIAVRLGRPQPFGDVVAFAVADGSGRWSADMVMPDTWPSGEVINQKDLQLVVMDMDNKTLASAPFTFEPAGNQPTSVPADADAPGADWVLALTSDANFDGVSDKVYYLPAAHQDGVTFDDPQLQQVAVAASNVQVVQRTSDGLSTLLTIDLQGGESDQMLFNFNSTRPPSGYLLALDPARGPFVNLQPYNAGGVRFQQIGINWNGADLAFRLADRPSDTPPPAAADQDMAYERLMRFLTALTNKNYSDAAGYYQGDYAVLHQQNPDVDANDHATLWQRACEVNGFVCLAPRTVAPTFTNGSIFMFDVTYSKPDGSIFTLQLPSGESQSTFAMSVVKHADTMHVITPPVMMP